LGFATYQDKFQNLGLQTKATCQLGPSTSCNFGASFSKTKKTSMAVLVEFVSEDEKAKRHFQMVSGFNPCYSGFPFRRKVFEKESEKEETLQGFVEGVFIYLGFLSPPCYFGDDGMVLQRLWKIPHSNALLLG
jgi:hypothetical protein